jgi:hypothetical protein
MSDPTVPLFELDVNQPWSTPVLVRDQYTHPERLEERFVAAREASLSTQQNRRAYLDAIRLHRERSEQWARHYRRMLSL